MRITTIGMLLLVATTSKAQKVWTLDDCINYALQHSAAVQKSRVAADNARQDRGAAAGGFIPTVSASVSGQFSWGRNVDPETNTYNTITTFYNGYSVSSSLTLFDGMRTWNEFRKARLAVKQHHIRLLATQQRRYEVGIGVCGDVSKNIVKQHAQ